MEIMAHSWKSRSADNDVDLEAREGDNEQHILYEDQADDSTESVREAEEEKTKVKLPSFTKRVGRWSLHVLITGTATILTALSFLSFMWLASPRNRFWHLIVWSRWLTRSVTISTLVIRFASAAQASLCTSMLASLALQHSHVLLPDATVVSIIRYENAGPHTLILTLFRSMRKGVGKKLGVITFILLCNATALQFCSTILLSDVASDYIIDSSVTADTAFALVHGAGKLIYGEQPWAAMPKTYPSFAEYAQPPSTFHENISDTGLSMRAFLPIYPESRLLFLESYTGPATIVDTRVVCTAPEVENLSVISPVRSSHFAGGPVLRGKIGATLDNVWGRQRGPHNKGLHPFQCHTLYGDLSTGDQWPLAMCNLDSNVGIKSKLEKGFGQRLQLGESYLIANTSGSQRAWLGELAHKLPTFGNASTYRRNREWLVIPSNNSHVAISISLCHTDFESGNYHIHAYRETRQRSETVLDWAVHRASYLTPVPNTLAVRQQLGATVASDAERGVFKLAPLESWIKQKYSLSPPQYTRYFVDHVRIFQGTSAHPYTIPMCNGYPWTRRFRTINSNIGQIAVFNDIVRHTGNPALALQAFFTTLFSMAYADLMPGFNVRQPAVTRSYKAEQHPVALGGFIIVVFLIGLHLAIMVLTVSWFVKSATSSIIGGAWLAVAQMMGEDSRPWMDEVRLSYARDGKVQKDMEALGIADSFVRIDRGNGEHRASSELAETKSNSTPIKADESGMSVCSQVS